MKLCLFLLFVYLAVDIAEAAATRYTYGRRVKSYRLCFVTEEPHSSEIVAETYPLFHCDKIDQKGDPTAPPVGSFAYICGPNENFNEYGGTAYESCTGHFYFPYDNPKDVVFASFVLNVGEIFLGFVNVLGTHGQFPRPANVRNVNVTISELPEPRNLETYYLVAIDVLYKRRGWAPV